MKTFTIDNETNNITVHASAQDAVAVANAERFRNEGGLAKLATEWPMARLVEIWNGIPGAEPAKKFKDRATAVSRIWKAIQPRGGTETEAGRPEAETPAESAVPVAAEDADVAQMKLQMKREALSKMNRKANDTTVSGTGEAA